MKNISKLCFIRKLLCICFAFTTLPLFADSAIRNYVGIVRGHYFDSLVQFMEKYRDNLRNDGYTTYAKYVDAYLKGGFGSGFVYVAPDGQNYIITNRHVISQSATASVEFENPDTGKKTTYDNLTILATDDEIDIAVLAFANGEKPFTNGMTLSTVAVKDGDDVWSAGFPGLGNDPIWQLGKGNVTNAKASIKELLDPSISTLIQHSAQVDSGNSGGPLMISSTKGTAGYAVIGINTWKAMRRESTNFAIPSSVILDFITRTITKQTAVSAEETITKRAAKFTSLFADTDADFTYVEKYISYDMVAKQGENAFQAIYQYAPTAVRNFIIEVFSDDPFEGLRYAVAYKIWQQYHNATSEIEKYTASAPVKSEDGASYTVAILDVDGNKYSTTTWATEQGLWRLSDSAVDSKSKKKSSGSEDSDKSKGSSSAGFTVTAPSLTRPYSLSIQVGTLISNTEDPSFEGKLDLSASRLGMLGLGFFGEFGKIDTYNCKFIGMEGSFRVPLDFTAFSFTPYGQAGFGFIFQNGFFTGTNMPGSGSYLEAGAMFIFDCGWTVKPGLGIAYNYQTGSINIGDVYNDSKYDYTKKSVKVYVIVAF